MNGKRVELLYRRGFLISKKMRNVSRYLLRRGQDEEGGRAEVSSQLIQKSCTLKLK
ncbi:hypothetical protein COOONC_19852 [Cooperia oncophora]